MAEMVHPGCTSFACTDVDPECGHASAPSSRKCSKYEVRSVKRNTRKNAVPEGERRVMIKPWERSRKAKFTRMTAQDPDDAHQRRSRMRRITVCAVLRFVLLLIFIWITVGILLFRLLDAQMAHDLMEFLQDLEGGLLLQQLILLQPTPTSKPPQMPPCMPRRLPSLLLPQLPPQPLQESYPQMPSPPLGSPRSTPAPAMPCANWCGDHEFSWRAKCSQFANCIGCIPCTVPPPSPAPSSPPNPFAPPLCPPSPPQQPSSPPMAPSPPSPPYLVCKNGAQPIADCLNRRFHEGRPSSSLVEVGILVHVFDKSVLENGYPRPEKQFISGSIISASYGSLFGGDNGGYILNPLKTAIYCSWSADGGTYGRYCYGGLSPSCVPGCTASAYGGEQPAWCGPSGGYCPYQPNRLHEMLANFRTNGGDPGSGTYNEVLIRSDVWRREGPVSTIDATYGNVQRIAGIPHVTFNLGHSSPFS